jgi:hypothetical protein
MRVAKCSPAVHDASSCNDTEDIAVALRDNPFYSALFPPEIGITECVDCKSTGYVYMNI